MNNWKNEKDKLEDLILNQKLSYEEIGKMYNCTGKAVRSAAVRLEINIVPRQKKYTSDICVVCKQEFIQKKNGRGGVTEACSIECGKKVKSIKKYKAYLEDNSIMYGKKISTFKKYFLEDQEYKCSICSMENIWNNKELVFILDHIDGNADNNNRNNLRLVCPNCDSQLDTFKSKNKNSARAKYRRTLKISEL